MEGRIQARFSVILVVTLFATAFVKHGQAEVHVTPQFPSIPSSQIVLAKCWSSLFNVQGCVIEVYKSSMTGNFENVEKACCKVFTEVDAKCWPKMFPLNPLFPPLLKNGCARINATGAPAQTTPKLPIVDPTKCWSSLVGVRGCVTEIYKSVFTKKFRNVEAMCCKAFSGVDAKCWPQMFPLNPFFPHLLKDGCSRIETATAAPTHK